MYDFDKENDRDVLREQAKFLQQELFKANIKLIQAQTEISKDQEIKQKLSEELTNIRKRVFDSKQERRTQKPPNNIGHHQPYK